MSPTRKDISNVSVVHHVCCGLDVHKDSISACLLRSDEHGREYYELREYETFTDDLVNEGVRLFEVGVYGRRTGEQGPTLDSRS